MKLEQKYRLGTFNITTAGVGMGFNLVKITDTKHRS